MKIATFNVNNINRRLPNLLRWLKDARPDVVVAKSDGNSVAVLLGVGDAAGKPDGSFIDLQVDAEASQIAGLLLFVESLHDLLGDLLVVAADRAGSEHGQGEHRQPENITSHGSPLLRLTAVYCWELAIAPAAWVQRGSGS
jgi:hypothetical protein